MDFTASPTLIESITSMTTAYPNPVQIRIDPVFDDGPIYYRVTVLDIDLTSETRECTVCDIFHFNNLEGALQQLTNLVTQGYD